MSIEQVVLEKLRALPPDKQQEVLDFVEFLQGRVPEGAVTRPRRSPKSLWADLGVQITAEDIAEVRREMWRNVAREDV
jgi:Protein of unknown function (DUF2281)